jgi:hypothetical protein
MAWIHPTRLEKTDGEKCNVPVALVPSGGEDPEIMNAIWGDLQKKDFSEKCVRKDFVSCEEPVEKLLLISAARL